MESRLENAREILEEETYKAGFPVAPKVSEDDSQIPHFSAKTSLDSKEHIYSYNPEYIEKKGQEKFQRTLKDLPRHEINHHKYPDCLGCPQDVNKHHDLFFVPAYEILSKKGYSHEDVDYLTNALQDTILHKDLKTNAMFSLEGIVNFFEDVGETIQDKKFTQFYEAHAKLNLHLWGNKQQKKKLQKFYKHDSKVNEVLKNFISKTKSLDFLDEKNWKKITQVYANEFSKLMSPGYAMPMFNHSGAGTKGKENDPAREPDGNIFQKQMKTKSFKQGKVMQANSSGEKCPPWINSFEAMDMVYQGLAGQLVIKAETYTNPESMPISWYQKRPFNEKDNLKHTSFGFNDKGEIELKKKTRSIEKPIAVKSSPKSFPEIKFGLVDISGSMKEDLNGGSNIGNTSVIPWGNNSKYHWACTTEYAIWEYLKQNHLLSQSNVSGAFFGTDTELVKGMENLKKKLLSPVFQGSTNLDLKKISDFFKGKDNLIYTASDGEISNWQDIKDDYMKMAKNHFYVHLHMGPKNQMTKDLEENNLKVVYAKDGKGIVSKVIDLTDKLFRKEV